MIQFSYKLSLVSLFILVTLYMYGQTPKPNFILYENETGATRNYRAGNSVIFKPGFIYNAQPGKSLRASIVDTAFTVVTLNNPTPGVVNPNNDNPYTPGNSYGNDVTEQSNSNGLTYPVFKAGSSSGNANMPKVIATPLAWFKTVPLTNNLNGAYHWKDVMGNATIKKYNTGGASVGDVYTLTRDKMRAYNFNPSIDLSYDSISKEILLKNTYLSQMTLIGVWSVKQDFGSDRFMFAVNGKQNESVVFTKNTVGETDLAKSDLKFGNDTLRNFLYRPVTIEGDSIKFKERNIRTGVYYRANQPDFSLWGAKMQTVISLGYKFDTTNVNNTSRFNPKWHRYPAFRGTTPELLVFDRQISPAECRIYETYLAVKYGLTLDKSYVDASDSVIWNISNPQNKIFHNRVTAYAREDKLGLNQKLSTSSYQETPFFSFLAANDAYMNGDSYLLPTANRLLVAGTQPGNTMPDGKYVIFGDNNASYNAFDSVSGAKIMKRKWLLHTNVRTFSNQGAVQHLTWSGNSLGISEGSNFTSSIVKSGGATTASAVTSIALKGQDGYFSWIVEQEYGPVTVKFGTNSPQLTPDANDYGFLITIDGQVQKIAKGRVASGNLFTVERGQKFEIEKNGQLIFLRVNGIRYKDTEIVIDTAHINSLYFGSVSIGANNFDIKLTSFRHGGFTDTGNYMELSFGANMATTLAGINRNNIFLMIDRSGDSISINQTERYYCTGIDIQRNKILFDNIFWDMDGNGRDVFTFGYTVPAQTQIIKHKTVDEENPEETESADMFKVYYRDMRIMDVITVQLQTAKPSPATIVMYDIAGKMVFKQTYPASNEVRYQDITMPLSGVYIIRVITNEKEYTRKVISKR